MGAAPVSYGLMGEGARSHGFGAHQRCELGFADQVVQYQGAVAGEVADGDSICRRVITGPAQLRHRAIRRGNGCDTTGVALDMEQRRAGRTKPMADRGASSRDDLRVMAGAT
ncbi:hypothetical protein SN15_14635 [Stenotrophomonas maltophilia]|nr:hypothetical protein SN15_14635 [Stenotrophomonas maltophilia]